MYRNMAAVFADYFDMVPAQTEDLKKCVYQLRYQVYCLENGFEDPENFPDGLEQDAYDAYSEHFLIRHRQSNKWVATTRLILPDPQDLERPFPIERHSRLECPGLLNHIPRNRIAEASRFCVSANFKRRHGESHTLAGIGPDNPSQPEGRSNNRRVLPNFALPLLACLIRMSIRHDITHWYAFMEPALARLVEAYGIKFIPLGPLVDYHGKRQPYLIRVTDMLSRLRSKNFAAWELLTNFGRFWQDSYDYKERSFVVPETDFTDAYPTYPPRYLPAH